MGSPEFPNTEKSGSVVVLEMRHRVDRGFRDPVDLLRKSLYEDAGGVLSKTVLVAANWGCVAKGLVLTFVAQ